jgi:Tfp pilus assembly protein PilF
MKKIKQLFIVAIFIIAVSCSSNDPQSQLKEIEELKNKGFPITSEQMEDINTFTAKGKSLMEQGKDKEASKALAKAIDILNVALDADIFNKAD